MDRLFESPGAAGKVDAKMKIAGVEDARVDGGAPDALPQASPQLDLTHGFWKDVSALSWLMNPKSGRLQFRDRLPGESALPGMSVHHEVLAGTLLRNLKDAGAQPVRMLEVLPVADGTMHHFLIVGFPISEGEGFSHVHLAGVAIDITHHNMRVDELAQQALSDELTGLYNLRGFNLFAEHELKLARRRGTRSAILYVDVDNLKKINDTDGHERGNAVLVETANLLRRVFRECDVIARLGGDEFAVFAADVNGDPQQMHERLVRAAAASSTSWSVSSGVGTLDPDPALRLTDLLTAADQAMYKNKFDKPESAAAE